MAFSQFRAPAFDGSILFDALPGAALGDKAASIPA